MMNKNKQHLLSSIAISPIHVRGAQGVGGYTWTWGPGGGGRFRYRAHDFYYFQFLPLTYAYHYVYPPVTRTREAPL